MKKKLLLVSVMVVAVVLCCTFAFMGCSKTKYTIGVQSGTTGQYYVQGDEDWDFAGFSNVKCAPYSNAGLAVNDMKAGNVNAVIIDEAPAKMLAKSIAGVKVIDVKLTDEEYAFGVDKNQPELKEKINTILASEKFNAAYKAILDKYFAGNVEIEGVEAKTAADASNPAGQLVVATNAEFAPFEYKVGNKFAGIDMEIAKYIADELNLELVIKDMEFDSVVMSVGKDNVDIAMSGLTVNETRKEAVDFTNTYYKAAQMLVVLDSDTSFDNCKTVEEVESVIKSK